MLRNNNEKSESSLRKPLSVHSKTKHLDKEETPSFLKNITISIPNPSPNSSRDKAKSNANEQFEDEAEVHTEDIPSAVSSLSSLSSNPPLSILRKNFRFAKSGRENSEVTCNQSLRRNSRAAYNRNLQQNATWEAGREETRSNSLSNVDGGKIVLKSSAKSPRRNVIDHKNKLFGESNNVFAMEMMKKNPIHVEDLSSTMPSKIQAPASSWKTKSFSNEIDTFKFPPPRSLVTTEQNSSHCDEKYLEHSRDNDGNSSMRVVANGLSDNSNNKKSTITDCKLTSEQRHGTKGQRNLFGLFVKELTQDLAELSSPTPKRTSLHKKTSFLRVIEITEYCTRDAPSVVSTRSTSATTLSLRQRILELDQEDASINEKQKIRSTTLDSGVKLVGMSCYHRWSVQERCKNSQNATWCGQDDSYRNNSRHESTVEESTIQRATSNYSAEHNFSGYISSRTREESHFQQNIFETLIHDFSRDLKNANTDRIE